ncbi:mitochondrial carrier [Nadsonia fulvescens var. elongata DSM 6958]|uniref:Mitochondrial carrier n=1 Tax=Nadsonia fulvescens var. elongata DSM 6958 TaxID=857566 RepID=A0A1E3PGU8_9ASCO|nr:mitochondrial carrier [Nadsonia fulvescens var. elongata DSM 6958]
MTNPKLMVYLNQFGQIRNFFGDTKVSSFIAGGVAGAISRTVVSPFERMKIIFQVQSAGGNISQYNGVIPTLTKMWKEEGWRGFMRGNGSNCIRIIPYSAVQFSVYTISRPHIDLLIPNDDPQGQYATWIESARRMTSGGLGGVMSVAVTYPLDLVRTRLSIQTATIGKDALRAGTSLPPSKVTQQPQGIWSVTKQVYRTEGGFKGLYRGIIPTTIGVAPFVGINFAVYEYLRDLVLRRSEVTRTQPTTLEKLTMGAISGAVAQTAIFPFDVLRRRFQIMTMPGKLNNFGANGGNGQYTSVWHAIKSIVHNEGMGGLYRGLSANLLKVIPSMAATWLSFEFVMDILRV